jgi:amino acid adenylation domain-containing protein
METMEKQQGVGYWLSPQQKLVWSSEGGASWNAAACALIEGPLDFRRLREALRRAVSRHEALRTVYRLRAGMKTPFQVVLDELEPAWEEMDLSGLDSAGQQAKLDELFQAAGQRVFDPASGPIVHASLSALGPDRTALTLSVPALAADGTSLGILLRELGALYADRPQDLPAEPLQYAQYAQWQNDLQEADDENARGAREFWKKQEPRTPLALPRDAINGPEGHGPVRLALDDASVRRIDAIAAQHGAKLENVLLAAWQILLWRLTGETQFETRVFLSGREYEELAGTIGLTGKFVPIPVRFDGDYTFAETIKRLAEARVAAAEWQEHFTPGDGADGLAAAFEYSELEGAQTCASAVFHPGRREVCQEPFQIKLCVRREGAELALEFHYDATRLGREAVARWSRHFETLLAAAVESPQTSAGALPLLTADERKRILVDWNATDAGYPRQTLHELFEAQAARTPEREAVRSGEQSLTFGDLNRRANHLAHYLRAQGVQPNSRVGLCLDRGVEMITALLAVLKSGGAFIPLSADNPKARLEQQMKGAAAILTEEKFLDRMPSLPCPALCIDRDGGLWSGLPDSNLPLVNTPEDLAYVIFTSGSTGVPKGVAIRHRNLVNYSTFIAGRLELERFPDGLQFATVSTLAADLGNTCIYPSLLTGGCLHVIPYEVSTDGARFAEYASRWPIDVLKIVPTHLEALLGSHAGDAILPRQFLVMGGDALTPGLLERIEARGASCEVFNHYGPTETTVGSLTLRLRDYAWREAQAVPIGRPIANTRVYILDPRREPVPVGVTGELFIGGAGVAAGYLDQPELTAERFVSDPFAGGEMYRTGDLARYQPDGNVEFLGRGDGQVKIRGFRIELGEVEAALLAHPSVRQAVVMARPDARGEKRLAAYVTGAQGEDLTAEALRAHLKELLPEPMIPSAIVTLAKMPLNANGKIDRQNLPEPEEVLLRKAEFIAPVPGTEEDVAAIWREVFHRERIGAVDDFFEAGGHSLLATQVVSRVRERFQVELPMRILFDQPTIRGLAQAVDEAREAGRLESAEPAIMPVSREAYRARRT